MKSRTVTIHEADDGTNFNFEHDCLKYEAMCDRADKIMGLLPGKTTGDLALLYSGDKVIEFKKALMELTIEAIPSTKNILTMDPSDFNAHKTIAYRYVSDASIQYLNNLWFKLSCIEKNTEYQQPYFALNPNEYTGEVRQVS